MQTLITLDRGRSIYNVPANITIRYVESDNYIVFGTDSKKSVHDPDKVAWNALLDAADEQALALSRAAGNL